LNATARVRKSASPQVRQSDGFLLLRFLHVNTTDRRRTASAPRAPRGSTASTAFAASSAFAAFLVGTLLLSGASLLSAQVPDLSIRPERTGWVETSRYDEVVRHLDVAASLHSGMHRTTFGYTNEGRALPLLVVSSLAEVTPERVRESGQLRILLMGNIHGGEVAGKEALLRLVRRLIEGEHAEWSRDWVLLIAPIYNADGNEAIALGNRPRQHGPLGGMGTRTNAQGLDLNRDQMKLDSPEARSLAALMTEWDPHVIVDLHVTNGTRHAYHLTYAPGLHPATPAPLDRYLRDELLPFTTQQVESRYGWHMWHYGNVGNRGGTSGWWTFDHRPRFVTNYAGLRNRLGILSEAYSYITFEDRVLATERFVDAILAFLHPRRDEARRLVETEDARDLRGAEIPLRAVLPTDGPPVEILMGDVTEEVNPWSGETILLRRDVVNRMQMPAGIAFQGTEHTTAPDSYVLPAELAPVVARLQAHGVRVETLPAGWQGAVDRFRVTTARAANAPFQGRTEREVEGGWERGDGSLPNGGFRVPVNQPLGRLAVLLLEPRADDGFLNWGILDRWIQEGALLPVWRIPPGS